jgi:hypothetical protein
LDHITIMAASGQHHKLESSNSSTFFGQQAQGVYAAALDVAFVWPAS